MELALDFEAHAERALPAPSNHRLRGFTVPLRTRGQVLKMALAALQPHLQAGDVLQGKAVWMTKSLLPLGGFKCVGRAAHPLLRTRTPCCSKCANWRRTTVRYGHGRERCSRMCSRWITSPRQDHGRSPCGPFSACRAGGCSATGKGHEAGARAAWHHRRGWPCVRDPGPRLVPPACSGAPITAANGLSKGTAWTRRKRAWRRKRCRCGCSPRSRRGPGPVAASEAARASPSARKHPSLAISLTSACDATS